MEYINLVVTLALLEYVFFVARTGKARGDAGIKAPAVSGDEVFERCYRVQQNTIEQLVIFIPAIYIFGTYVNAVAAAGIGLVFVIGRFLYFKTYVSDPAKRAPGFVMTMLSNVVLVLGSLIGIGIKLI